MKYFKGLWLIILLSCSANKKESNEADGFQREPLSKVISSNNGVLISCFRCNCINFFVAAMIKQKVKIPVYGDSSCVKERPMKFKHLSQDSIDIIFERNYNAILFKNANSADQFKYKILKNEEADDFIDIFNEFFTK